MFVGRRRRGQGWYVTACCVVLCCNDSALTFVGVRVVFGLFFFFTDVVVPVLNQVQYHVGMGADPEGLMSYYKSKNTGARSVGLSQHDHAPYSRNPTLNR